MSVIFIYVAVSSDEAKKIAEAVVADRLAACANILPGMESVYHWQGKIQSAQETVVIFKTRAELFPALEARVKELHSYDTPCIVALPVTAGHTPFLDWILEETKP